MSVIQSFNPSDGSLLGEVSVADEGAISRAVQRADEVFRASWRDSSFADRSRLFRKLRRLVVTKHRALAELVAKEQGKPFVEVLAAEVFPVLDTLSFLAQRGPRILRDRRAPHLQPFLAGRKARFRMRPFGVVAVISPWNYPLSLPLCQIATAIYAGNAVVFKPSPLTPLVGEAIVELFHDAGFDEGVLSIVHGGADVGEALIDQEKVRLVSFTGGTTGGRGVMAAAARGPKKVLLELGGKDPAIVLEDADLERTARGIAWSSMMNAGQTCASIERVFVAKSIYDQLVERLTSEVAKIRIGDPLSDETDMGPLVADFQRDKVLAHIEDARTRGGEIATGGGRRSDCGELFLEPTVLLSPPRDGLVSCEETFGPLLSVEPVEDDAEALLRANETAFGLTASVWSRNHERAHRLSEKLECGVVTVNSHLTSFAEPNSIWGGVKASGFGRTHGPFGLLEAVQPQYLDADHSSRPEMWWYPYTPRFLGILEELFTFLGSSSARVRIASALRFVPQLGYLAKHLPIFRMGPGLSRYLR